jgi:hypothetical protein
MRWRYGLIVLPLLFGCKHKIPEPALPSGTTTGTVVTPTTPVTVTNPPDSVCFVEQILPILVSNCAKSGCHDTGAAQQGVMLDTYAHVRTTVSGHLLLQSIQDTGPLGMPPTPEQKLSAAQVLLIKKWVNEGMRDGIDCQGPCDSTNVTFSGTVLPILQNSCIGCHNNTAPVFTGHAGVKPLALDGKLLCAINHRNGCAAMPLNAAKLSECKIRLITKWVNAGSPDN